jgi:multiple sugar transport system substrate-binding protein
MTTTLRAIGWDHPRCRAPMEACAGAWLSDTGTAVRWSWRSLESFGDQPLDQLAPSYDLLVIDHPFCGTAAATGCLRPLDDLIVPGRLEVLAADAVGASHTSYEYAGRQWGLATDAACQVAAVRADLLEAPLPGTWDDVIKLAREHTGRVALPLAPAHAISSFLTLCANAGDPAAVGPERERLVAPETGESALELLAALHRLGPRGTTTLEPPEVLTQLTSSDDLLYVPLTYGYVTYARADAVERPCRFVDIPSSGNGPVGAVLGGAGLAVSAASDRPVDAAAFAAWASGAEAQRTIVSPRGGQPGSLSAWTDPALDAEAGGFFSGTLATMESAWVRPRDVWWPAFQLDAGRLIVAALAEGLAAEVTLEHLDALYLDHRERWE